jgi:hypothetical protein
LNNGPLESRPGFLEFSQYEWWHAKSHIHESELGIFQLEETDCFAVIVQPIFVSVVGELSCEGHWYS